MTTTSYVIDVSVLADTTQLKTGTADAVTSINSLADAVDVQSADMKSSLSSIDDGVATTFGPTGSLAAAPDLVNTSGRKLKAVGANIGQEFSQAMSQGISSGDIVGTTAGIFSSLSALPGIGAIGAGLGGALVLGIVKKAQEASQAITDSVNKSFEAIEVKAGETNAAIIKAFEETLTLKTTFADVGGGDAEAGFARLNALAETLGLKVSDVVESLNNPGTAAAAQVRDRLREAADAVDKTIVGSHSLAAAQATAALDLGRLIDENNDKHTRTLDLLKGERDVARDVADATGAAADASERYAANIDRATRQSFVLKNTLNGMPGTGV